MKNKSSIFCATIALLLMSYTFSSSAQNHDDLQTHLRDDMYTSISIEHADKTIDIPLIKFASQQALSKGTIVLLSDAHSQKSSNHSLYKLAEALPNWGWNTLFLTPQTAHFIKPPEILEADAEETNEDIQENADNETDELTETTNTQTNNTQTNNTEEETSLEQTESEQSTQDEQAPESANSEISTTSPQVGIKAITLQQAELGFTQEEYTRFIKSLLEQINNRFLQQPGYQILIVEGKTASVAVALLTEDSTLALNALILNNPYWPNYELNQSIAKQVAQLPLPVLDLINMSDNYWSMQTRAQRLAQTRINLKPFYRQRELAGGPLHSLPKEYLAKEIVGWTRYLGW